MKLQTKISYMYQDAELLGGATLLGGVGLLNGRKKNGALKLTHLNCTFAVAHPAAYIAERKCFNCPYNVYMV